MEQQKTANIEQNVEKPASPGFSTINGRKMSTLRLRQRKRAADMNSATR
jgi:hypothetical protein